MHTQTTAANDRDVEMGILWRHSHRPAKKEKLLGKNFHRLFHGFGGLPPQAAPGGSVELCLW